MRRGSWALKIEFTSRSPEQTGRFAEELAGKLPGGLVIAMDGDLGAGKTCFAQGFAKGLGIKEPVTSPTYTLVNEYGGGRLEFFHFDVYRLEDSDEFYAAGLDEYFYRGGICIIEWSGIIEDALPDDAIRIKITGTGDNRKIEVETDDSTIETIVKEAAGI